MAWTEDKKAEAIKLYTEEDPTPETSTEIIKTVAEQLEESPNGVRMILVKAGVYVKKDPAAASAETSASKKSTGTGRVSKESQISALKEAIKSKGAEVEDEILDKLTGKAAAYFTTVINSIGA